MGAVRTFQVYRAFATGWLVYSSEVATSGPFNGQRKKVWINKREMRHLTQLSENVWRGEIATQKLKYLPDLEGWKP
jgi:hypothetical protein